MSTSRIKQRLQAVLKQRGIKGMIGLLAAFREFDLDHSGNLNWEEFGAALQKCGVAPSPQDTRALFLEFDADGNNEISYNEFVAALRGSLSARRRSIITKVFNLIDSDKDGVVSMTDIGACFNPKNHPEVKAGLMTVQNLLNAFFETFAVVSKNGVVTLDQFMEYYANASFYEDDDTFERSMEHLWSPPPSLSGSGRGTSLENLARNRENSLQGTSATTGSTVSALDQLREQLSARGAKGIIGLSRKFRIMDDDNSKSLSLSEFKKAMRECSLNLTELQLNELFAIFDRDRSGSISYDEFLQGVRGKLSDRRKRLIGMAFDKLDKNGSGVIDPEDVLDCYDSSKHPDVIAGKRSSEDVLREFLDTFDVGGEKDGKVTRNEFENYYANVSSSIDSDDYFELMIRNAWHISGGEGWSANSANRRVLVTHADGRQTVEEIKNDLGLKQGDAAGAIARLRAQGRNASSISFHDGGDDNNIKFDSNAILNRYKGAGSSSDNIFPQDRPSTAPVPSVAFAGRINLKGKLSSGGAISSSEKLSNTIAPTAVKDLPDAGLIYILNRLKTELKNRGAPGFIGLQRKFRIMDDDNSKSLDLGEFKKAMKEMNMNVSDAELRMVFDHFDKNRNGSIDFEEFIQGVRNPLNERRLQLVAAAFAKLDRDGSGEVDAQEIANMYDASQHPEVIAGRKTADAVFREFLDTFDVGGEKDGKVTRNEFENYYTNIGANIDNDDYFELMIRNAWHISGGEGWSANSANRRVLVTHADGRQTVEEIKDDLGLKPGDKAGMIARLRAQGVNASSVSTTDAMDNTSAPRRSKSLRDISLSDASENKKVASESIPPEIAVALKGPGAKVSRKTLDMSERIGLPKSSVPVASPGVQMILTRLKAQLKARGSLGFIGLQRKFRIMDDDGSKSLSLGEFKKGLTESKINATESEMRLLFEHFDTDSSGSIDFEEFVQGVRDPLNDRRLKLVHMAFSQLDKTQDGFITPQDLVGAYDASKHPDVLSNKRTADDVLREFLDTFDVGGEKDGKVTRNEFENYYANIGASIDNDDYFELMIRNAWHISGGEGWSANSANRRVLVTHADGRQTVEEIKDDLGLKLGDKAGMIARLRAQGLTVLDVSSVGNVEEDDSSLKTKRLYKQRTSQAPPGVLPGTGPATYKGAKPIAMVAVPGGCIKVPAPRKSPVPSVAIRTIIDKLKAEMASRGARGFIGLQRLFRIMDDDGSKSLSMAEFKKAMHQMNMGLNETEIRMLFEHFDVDSSCSIDFEEFIQGVRDPLSERRLKLVHAAFAKLDRDGSGEVDAQEIANMYDASQHPEVIAGRKTADDVFREFLDTFDVGGEKDGKVTRNEFENYYANIGANIDNDDYFELMIRNAWHISGGEGWSANSANRRVLVTHADGRQTVEEIKDDLGLKPGDKAGMIARLRAQGVNASSVSTVDSYEDKSNGKSKNIGAISRNRKVNPSRIEATAGASTKGPKDLMKNTLMDLEDRGSSRAAPQPRGEASYGIQNIIRQIKQEMVSRGSKGYIGLQRKFRIMDDDGSKSLNLAEFKKGLKEMRINISDPEMRMLFEHFDSNRNGSIDFEEFIQGVRDPLNERRRNLVIQAFAVLDVSNDGFVDAEELIDRYDASKHPDVISGKKTANQVLEEFLDTFDVGGEKDGKVTRNEFENYYTNIGANIDNDDYFELMIRNAWHISGGEGWSANSANRRVLVTHADGRQTVEEIKNDLGLKHDDKPGAIARLRAQGVNATSVNIFGGGTDGIQEESKPRATSFKQLRDTGSAGKMSVDSSSEGFAMKRRPPSSSSKAFQSSIVFGDDSREDAPPAVGGPRKTGLMRMGGKKMASTLQGSSGIVANENLQDSVYVPLVPNSLAAMSLSRNVGDIESVLKKFREQLAQRGARGIIGLSRRFRSMDDDGSQALSVSEFKKAVRESSIDITEQDFRMLFGRFDRNGDGQIDFDEFLGTVRGELSDRRKRLIGMAFDKLDKNGSGVIDPEDVLDCYDASKHPDVIAGKRSSEDVLREFLDTFDVGGEKDGKVTRNEFENYYANVSSSIDSDDYFELMIRNAWHISGGEGWSANSANRRVLATHADGRQTVEEIKNDLGLKQGDAAGAIARLRAQGINASSVSFHDGGEDNKKMSKAETHRKNPTFNSTFTIG